MKQLIGTGVALITPFNKIGSIDFTSLTKLVNHVIMGGVEYVVALGTTAETATLSSSEKLDVLKHIQEAVKNRVPVVVGLGGNNTAELIAICRNTEYKNATAFLSVCLVLSFILGEIHDLEIHLLFFLSFLFRFRLICFVLLSAASFSFHLLCFPFFFVLFYYLLHCMQISNL